MTEARSVSPPTGRPGISRRRALGVMAGCAGAAATPFGLAGCSQREPLLRIASNVWPGYELMHAARALGRLDEDRLRLIEMPSTTDVLQALASGAIDGGGLTLDELLGARADGLDLCAVLVFDESRGADALMARPDLPDLAALAGRRIGVEQTATGALVLSAALHAARLTIDQVKPVYVTAGDHLSAWKSGDIDALVCFEPVLSTLAMQGAHSLFDSSAMPGVIVDLLGVHRSVLKQSPQALRHLVQQHFAVLDQWQREPGSLYATLGARMGLAAPQVAGAFSGLSLLDLAANRQWLDGSGPQLTAAARALQQRMLESRLLHMAAPLDDIAEPASLPTLAAGAGT